MRENRMSAGTSNPATKFLTWKSEHQKFAYWDKLEKVNVFVEMPIKFLALSKYKTIKGWNQKKEGAIISNEVKSLKDEFVVNFYKKGDRQEIARGPWNEIKETVESWGGKYVESVYVMLPGGEVVNLHLSGASLSTWFEFQNNQTSRFFDEWVVVNGFKEGKSGAVKFTYPVFEWGEKIGKLDSADAQNADVLIAGYEASYFQEVNPKRERVDAAINMVAKTFEATRQPTPPPSSDKEYFDYDPDDLGF